MDYALIGSYTSDKLVITDFDIDRSNSRNIQESSKRKVVGRRKQSVNISLSGVLVCTSFQELEEEVDKLLQALNHKSIKLVLGSRPSLYWLVSWVDADLARKPKNGGYVLPISLSFECLEETAAQGIPTRTGYRKAGTIAIDTRGNIFSPASVPGMKSGLWCVAPSTAPTQLLSHNAHTASIANIYGRAVLTYTVNHNSFTSSTYTVASPINGKPVAVSISYTDTHTTISVNDTISTIDIGSSWEGYVVGINPASQVKAEAALDFIPTSAYIEAYLGKITEDSFIKVVDVKTTPVINRKSQASIPVSFITTGNHVYAAFNDFGFDGVGMHTHTLNAIDSTVTSTDASGISYPIGSKTLFPYLVPGKNTITLQNCIYAYVAYLERFY